MCTGLVKCTGRASRRVTRRSLKGLNARAQLREESHEHAADNPQSSTKPALAVAAAVWLGSRLAYSNTKSHFQPMIQPLSARHAFSKTSQTKKSKGGHQGSSFLRGLISFLIQSACSHARRPVKKPTGWAYPSYAHADAEEASEARKQARCS